MSTRKAAKAETSLDNNPTWYKDAIIYEVHLRAFKDSNGDGIGDLNGLTESLDYLQDLGVTAIWLLPFYPSPLRDGGYDIADYTNIHPSYGTLRDFSRLMREAHRRGLRVITELVINHTSNEHPWFQRARRAPPGSKWRNFYVWSDTQERYKDARIIFKDFETSNWAWDPVAKSYYWHRFYSHQPDLNFDNPHVQAAVMEVLDFWLELGVDGMRLDAVPYLFERDGTNCENLPETHAFLKKLRAHVDEKWRGRMLLAEANQWPADAAAYFGEGDECHMNFHFPLMPRMFMAVELEDSFPIVNILRQTPKLHPTCQWATFLRNHDELTLEMVTDEDRDYMYRTYAQDRSARINLGIRRRLGPLLKVRRKMELMNALLLSLPGTPVLYYGDEIGMGDNIYLGDRDGVRTPMQWSADANAGFSRAKPQQLYLPVIIDAEHHYQSINVEAQQMNTSSLLWWMKRALALRKQFKVFGRGEIEFLHPENGRVIAFLREYEGMSVLVIGNLSRFSQFVELELGRFQGRTPVELFGRTRFPAIGEKPYVLTLSPHGFFWFLLETPPSPIKVAAEPPTIHAQKSWLSLLEGESRTEFARALAEFTKERRWFRGKSRSIEASMISDVIPIAESGQAQKASPDPSSSEVGTARLEFAALTLTVEYAEGAAETYFVPVGYASGARADEIIRQWPGSVIAYVIIDGADSTETTGILYDALAGSGFPELLLQKIAGQRTLSGENGKLVGSALKALKSVPEGADLTARSMGADQTNTAIVFGEQFVFKIVRLIEEGPSTEQEIGRYLAGIPDKHGVPRLAGSLEYRVRGRETAHIGVLHQFVRNRGDAFQLTLDSLDRFFDRVVSEDVRAHAPPQLPRSPLGTIDAAVRTELSALIGPFFDRVRRLGVRTAELHLALSRGRDDPAFMPEPFNVMHQQSLYQSAQNLLARTFASLRRRVVGLPERERELSNAVLAREDALLASLNEMTRRKIAVDRIRCHGDFHLGQVLWTGDDFVIIDFEGEPARPITERRYKRCPLRDVAGMLRSFHYAGATALRRGRARPVDIQMLEKWVDVFVKMVSSVYLEAYLGAAGSASFIPSAREDIGMLLDFYMTEKCIYEVGYEIHNRPDWLEIPLRGLLDISNPPT